MIQLPQYPTYFDTDTAEKQIEVVRSYLGELKTALESNMSNVKMSDLDQDVQDLFEALQKGITVSDEELLKVEADINSLYALHSKINHLLQSFYNALIAFEEAVAQMIETNYCTVNTLLEVNGNSLLKGAVTSVGTQEVNNSDLLVFGRMNVTKASIFNDNVFSDGTVTCYASTKNAGTPEEVTDGGDFVAIGKTVNGERIGGNVYAEKYRITGMGDNQYFRHMTAEVKDRNDNVVTLNYLGF